MTEKKPIWIPTWLGLLIAAGVIWLIIKIADGGSGGTVDSAGVEPASDPVPTTADAIAVCAERGVAYFKEIGSYPTLSSAPDTGRAAEDVALERCQRSTMAFPDVSASQ